MDNQIKSMKTNATTKKGRLLMSYNGFFILSNLHTIIKRVRLNLYKLCELLN